ncbi:50S ribosomal protein L31e [archaeon]|nr:50S ribosomal protein L31e [archaeon]
MERIYTIPLRRKTVKVARYKRSPKALKVIKEFLKKHMKSDEVRIGRDVNEFVWAHGIKQPPARVKVKAVKDESGVVTATLEGEGK